MQEVLKWMCKERDGDSKGFLEIINNTYLTVNSCVPVSVFSIQKILRGAIYPMTIFMN